MSKAGSASKVKINTFDDLFGGADIGGASGCEQVTEVALSDGHKVGRSDPGLFGGVNHYDNSGKKVGHSSRGLFGSYTNYDKDNKKVGKSNPGFLGGFNHYEDD